MSHARFFHVLETGDFLPLASLEEAVSAFKEKGYIWLEYYQPAKEELSCLIEPFGLHPLSIEDCIDENQIPKIEDYPEHSFILFNGFNYVQDEIRIYEIDFFIGKKFLITSSPSSDYQRPLISDLERFLKLDPQNIKLGPAFLAHVLLDTVVDQKFEAVEALEEELNEAEDMILDDNVEFQPEKLLNLRRELLALRKSLFHEREILMKICRSDCRYIMGDVLLLYRDIYDHLAKFFELTESYRDIVTSLMEMHLSMLNNQMAKAANDTNATVRRLTFITTIFMPLSLLAGIGGMSEWSMMTGPENWRITYPLFLVAMMIIGVSSYYLLKWIERKGGD